MRVITLIPCASPMLGPAETDELPCSSGRGEVQEASPKLQVKKGRLLGENALEVKTQRSLIICLACWEFPVWLYLFTHLLSCLWHLGCAQVRGCGQNCSDSILARVSLCPMREHMHKDSISQSESRSRSHFRKLCKMLF